MALGDKAKEFITEIMNRVIYAHRRDEALADLEALVSELNDRDKEWFQVIESFMGFHPVSMTDALEKGIGKMKALQAENDVLRETLEWYSKHAALASLRDIMQDSGRRAREALEKAKE